MKKTSVKTVCKYVREWDKLLLSDRALYRRSSFAGQDVFQLVLPDSLKKDLFQALHVDLGHQGHDRTTSLFKQRFHWPGLESWIKDKILRCQSCPLRKSKQSSAPLVSISSCAPMDVLCLHFLKVERSKGGFEHILVITDHFTRH